MNDEIVSLLSKVLNIPRVKAEFILQRAGGLRQLLALDAEQAMQLVARMDAAAPVWGQRLGALCQLVKTNGTTAPVSYRTPELLAELFTTRLRALVVEEVHAAFLTRDMRLIAHRVMTRGSDSVVVMDVTGILREAIRVGAPFIALAHNHPSGDPEPSAQDIAVTRRIAEAAETLDVVLVDHIVVGRMAPRNPNGWVSLRLDGHYAPTPRAQQVMLAGGKNVC